MATNRVWKFDEMIGKAAKLQDLTQAVELLGQYDYTNFGVCNSDTYRKMLLKLYENSSLPPEVFCMVLVLSGFNANKNRFMFAVQTLASQGFPNVTLITDFVSKMKATPSESSNMTQMPYSNVATSFPNVAFIGSIIISADPTDITAAEFRYGKHPECFAKNYVGQINLASELQMIHKQSMVYYWNEVVTGGTKNYKKGFQEEYYKNVESDKYELVMFPDQDHTAYSPPYTVEMMLRYIKEVYDRFRHKTPFYPKDDRDDDGNLYDPSKRGGPAFSGGTPPPPPPPPSQSPPPPPKGTPTGISISPNVKPLVDDTVGGYDNAEHRALAFAMVGLKEGKDKTTGFRDYTTEWKGATVQSISEEFYFENSMILAVVMPTEYETVYDEWADMCLTVRKDWLTKDELTKAKGKVSRDSAAAQHWLMTETVFANKLAAAFDAAEDRFVAGSWDILRMWAEAIHNIELPVPVGARGVFIQNVGLMIIAAHFKVGHLVKANVFDLQDYEWAVGVLVKDKLTNDPPSNTFEYEEDNIDPDLLTEYKAAGFKYPVSDIWHTKDTFSDEMDPLFIVDTPDKAADKVTYHETDWKTFIGTRDAREAEFRTTGTKPKAKGPAITVTRPKTEPKTAPTNQPIDLKSLTVDDLDVNTIHDYASGLKTPVIAQTSTVFEFKDLEDKLAQLSISKNWPLTKDTIKVKVSDEKHWKTRADASVIEKTIASNPKMYFTSTIPDEISPAAFLKSVLNLAPEFGLDHFFKSDPSKLLKIFFTNKLGDLHDRVDYSSIFKALTNMIHEYEYTLARLQLDLTNDMFKLALKDRTIGLTLGLALFNAWETEVMKSPVKTREAFAAKYFSELAKKANLF